LKINIVTGTYNEADNVEEFHRRLTVIMSDRLSGYDYEIIVIDNASTDQTVEKLRLLAQKDPRLKVIINNRNFGHVRSGCHAILQAKGDAVIAMASDLQDPPELIPEFIKHWEQGIKVVLAQKQQSEESPIFFIIRKTYYRLLDRLSDVHLPQNVTGFGLYDQCVIDDLRRINDPYPYFRGLICDLGYPQALIPFVQPIRKRGLSKNNFYTLWDLAMLGFTNHSKVPLRLATFIGMGFGVLSFFIGLGYLVYKLLFWDSFQVGTAPLVIGLFFIGAVQLFFLGIVGEYVGAILTQVLRRPLVTERERINFD
jgi:glycosyltransferase involved in cell wall biosynthesis